MSELRAVKSRQVSRRELIRSGLQEVLGRLFGRDAAEIDIETPLINLGADSLFLLQASQSIQKEFKVKIPFRLLLEDLSTVDALALYLDERLPAEFATNKLSKSVPPELPSTPEQESDAPREVHSQAVSAQAPTASSEPKLTFEKPPVIPAETFETQTPSALETEEPDSLVQQIITQQLQINARQLELMAQQLDLLRSEDAGHKNSALTDTVQPAPRLSQIPQVATHSQYSTPESHSARDTLSTTGDIPSPVLEERANAPEVRETAKQRAFEPDTFVPFQPFKKSAVTTLNERQRQHLESLIARLNHRTQESKRLTQAYRPFLADSRAVAGFRMAWKEMVYPILIRDAQGSRIRDVDGNEYIDLNMGFGSLLFGHSPSFIIETLQQQLGRGIQLGPQAHQAGKIAQLICELTGVERVAFCNSGTEAIMTALRLARAVTGRDKIALFDGCYHGTFDGVLVRGDKTPEGNLRAIPMAPGVPQHMIENVLLLKYNSPESIEILKAHAHELAAVLIEPPRSRRPDVQPKEFLHELRKLTREAGAALIFDEVVTGFRFHPGGAQAMFDVQADLVAYGKAVGGGLPVAVIAGRAEFMDAVDGGMWNYGDASYPAADVTYFTGTYFKHPLIMPALWATLNHIKERGLQLQEELDEKTTYVVDAISAYLEQTQTPMRVARLGSLFRFLYSGELKYIDLFYYHLLEKGIYLSETRNCFLSTAHTDADLEQIIRIVKESIDEMHRGGFLPGIAADAVAVSDHDNDAAQGLRVPLTESQKQIWTLAQLSEEGARAYNQSTTLHLRGTLNLSALRAAFQEVVNRHEALRATFDPDGDYQQIAASLRANIPLIDFSHLETDERQPQVAEWLAEESQQAFDLVHGPLLKAFVLKLEENEHIFVLTTHHIISDGWSFGSLLGELKELYAAACEGRPSRLHQPRRFSDYARLQAEKQQSEEMAQAERYWLEQFSDANPVLELPTDRPRSDVQTFNGAQQHLVMKPTLGAELKILSAEQNCTLFMLLLGGFKVLLHHLTNQKDLVVGVPSAGQISPESGYLIGYCVNLLPLHSHLTGDMTFLQYLASLKDVLANAYDYQDYPYSKLLKKLNLTRSPGRSPVVEAVFNLDRSGPRPDFYGLEVEVAANHNQSSKFDITFDVTETETGLVLDCEYNTDLFDRRTARIWMNHYETILQTIARQPEITLDELREILRLEERQQQNTQSQELKAARLKKISSIRRQAVHG